MAQITKGQIKEIRLLTRRANRRLERAGYGQWSALVYYAERMTGSQKFSAATKGLSYEEAQKKIEDLSKFLESKISTISGWKEVKAQAVSKTRETLTDMGYDLTDEELAEILIQIGDADRREFYRAINLVQAAKTEAGDEWTPSVKQISSAIMEGVSAFEALKRALKARASKK